MSVLKLDFCDSKACQYAVEKWPYSAGLPPATTSFFRRLGRWGISRSSDFRSWRQHELAQALWIESHRRCRTGSRSSSKT